MNSERPLILAVDTATSCTSVALTAGDAHGGELLASLTLNSKVTHSRRLLSALDWLLMESDVSLTDVDGLAVGLGPGSFTGLRIAMATVKGLAVAAGKPLLGVPTLDALAFRCGGERPVCAVLDARKKEVYTAWYSLDEQGVQRRHGGIRALAPELLAEEISKPVLMVGDGLFAYGRFLQERLGNLLSMAPLPLHYPSGSSIGFLCCEQLLKGEVLDLNSAVPLYVRASDAELSLIRKEEQGHQ